MSAEDRIAQLQALNRTYLRTLREVNEHYEKQDAEFLQLHARVRELEARPPPTPLPAADRVLGVKPDIFVLEMGIIQRDTGKSFPEAFALWQVHAAACAQEREAEARANASRAGLREWFAGWASEGFGERVRSLCNCGDWDCPTKDVKYVEGRGFVDAGTLAAEEERAAEAAAEAAAEVAAAAKPKSWADRVREGHR